MSRPFTVRYIDETKRDGTKFAAPTQEKKLQRLAERNRIEKKVKQLFVGIASGEDIMLAMRMQHGEKQKEQGITEMIAITESRTVEEARSFQEDILDYFKKHSCSILKVDSNIERLPKCSKYYVYLAVCRK